MPGVDRRARSARVLEFVATGGYALQGLRPLQAADQGRGRAVAVTHPELRRRSTGSTPGIIVEATMLDVRFRNGRIARQGRGERSAPRCSPGDTFFFAGLVLEVERMDVEELIVRATSQAGAHPDLWRRAHADLDQSRRPGARACSPTATGGRAFPTMCANGWRCRSGARSCPSPGSCWSRRFQREKRHYMVVLQLRSGWNANQSLGMLITKRMESRGLKPLRLRRHRLCDRGLGPEAGRPTRARCFSPDILEHEFVDWVQQSYAAASAPFARWR